MTTLVIIKEIKNVSRLSDYFLSIGKFKLKFLTFNMMLTMKLDNSNCVPEAGFG